MRKSSAFASDSPRQARLPSENGMNSSTWSTAIFFLAPCEAATNLSAEKSLRDEFLRLGKNGWVHENVGNLQLHKHSPQECRSPKTWCSVLAERVVS